jgi:hypothetical protein
MSSSSSHDATPKPSSNLFTSISAAELRTWAPFVRKDVIRAGDVVLSRGQDKESSAIALATGGRYSHAAIFLPFRFDDTIPLRLDHDLTVEEAERKYGTFHFKGVHLDLVEADDYGVGAVPPRTLSIAFGGRRYDVIRLSGERPPKNAVLLRHPDIVNKSVDEHAIEKAVQTFADAELLRRYSSADRLVGPLPLPRPIKRMLGRVLLWRYPQPERLILPGCFCSELVVKFFERLGVPLFADTSVPEHISPNHLVPSRSMLKAVPDAIITAADIPDDAHGEVIGILQLDVRTKYHLSLVKVTEDTELFLPQVQKTIKDTAATTKKLEEIIRQSERTRALIHDAGGAVVQGQILDALSDGCIAPTLRRRLEELLVTTIYLKFLRDHLRSAKLPAEAGSVLSLSHDRSVAELFYSHERTRALVRMSRARRLPAKTSRHERMSALADWRSQKALWGREMAALNRPIRRRSTSGGPSNADTEASVTKVLDEVTAKVMTVLRIT